MAATLLACLLAAALPACGGDGGGSSEEVRAVSDASGASDGADTGRSEPRTVDPATAGTLSGVIRVEGDVPAPERFTMAGEAWCIGRWTDAGGAPDTSLLVQDGRLANAFVWIKSDLDDYRFDESPGEVSLDQKNCMFEPRVFGARPRQTIKVLNSDDVMHNVHFKPKKSRESNVSMPFAGQTRDFDFSRAEVMVPIVCDVHPWMKSWMGLVDHPFFAVTGADGSYRFEGLPPGEYTVGVWHETLGTKELNVTIGPNQDAVADASF